ncbi:protein HESO1-like isoform X1 [Triticum dicoccoides]|uniref:protein HESO1-like isoform X1 n=1 Tax=Triticum dicoccoides TaxID=85692 RepID=UPI000E7C6445|nr:protein HESO1-like isoform X1 [Triticum dicoccoides]
MVELVQNYDVLEKCTKDILSIIKPTEADQNKRLHTIQEIVDSIYLVGRLGDAAVKPFGSFLSKLYAKSGDLDVSVELPNVLGFPTSKEKKQSLLGELMRALEVRGVSRDVNFIPTARVPVLQYVSNHFGVSCDISIDNYPGRLKSKVLYWINTLDGRFGDMVLLVKEWAKAQNINDPKDGTLNSYSLCLLVLFHFQTCKPAILPPMNEFLDVNISAESGPYNEKNLDEMCAESIAKFRRRDIGQRNQSSLSHLLATFFEKFCRLGAHSSDHVISTYMGRLQRKQGGLNWMTKSCYLFVEDPFQRLDNAARTVDVLGLHDIATALKNAKNIVSSDGPVDRNEFLSLLCTPEVGSKLGARATAGRYATPATTLQEDRFTGFLERLAANPFDNQHRLRAQGSTGSRSIHSPQPQGYNSGRQAAARRQSQQRRGEYTSDRQASGHALNAMFDEILGRRLHNGSAPNSRSQAFSSRSPGQYW